MIPVKKDFSLKIIELKAISKQKGEPHLLMRSGELHKIIGGYETNNHRLPICCDAMYDAMQEGDEIIQGSTQRERRKSDDQVFPLMEHLI